MSKLQLAGLLTLSLAIGLNIANFSPLVTGVATGVNYMLHFLPIIPVLIGALLLNSRPAAGSRWVTITMLAILVGDLVIMGYSIGHPDPNGFGTHNFNDFSPVVMDFAGAFLWFAGLSSRARARRADRMSGNVRNGAV